MDMNKAKTFFKDIWTTFERIFLKISEIFSVKFANKKNFSEFSIAKKVAIYFENFAFLTYIRENYSVDSICIAFRIILTVNFQTRNSRNSIIHTARCSVKVIHGASLRKEVNQSSNKSAAGNTSALNDFWPIPYQYLIKLRVQK